MKHQVANSNLEKKGLMSSYTTEVVQELEQSSWRSAIYWLGTPGLLSLLSYPPQNHKLRIDISPGNMGPLTINH
jgi:cyanate permease